MGRRDGRLDWTGIKENLEKCSRNCLLERLREIYTLRTGLLNCLNARSRVLTFRHRTSCI